MNLLQLLADLGVDVPAQGRTEETGAKVVVTVFRIAKHYCKVFRHIMEQYMQGMYVHDDCLRSKDAVFENVAFGFGMLEGEVLRISCAQKLQSVFHYFFAAEFTAGKMLQDQLAILLIQLLPLLDPLDVSPVQFQPPIRL